VINFKIPIIHEFSAALLGIILIVGGLGSEAPSYEQVFA
jgi:hypothetical protein